MHGQLTYHVRNTLVSPAKTTGFSVMTVYNVYRVNQISWFWSPCHADWEHRVLVQRFYQKKAEKDNESGHWASMYQNQGLQLP